MGGPFEITATKAATTPAEAHDVYLQLGQPSSINLVMGAEQAKNATTLAGVTVKASAIAQIFSSENKGLATNLSQAELQAKPMGNRSIDDIVRLDPRIQVMDQGVGSFSAGGMNNRYNLLSVDGVPQGDPFGLNANGLPDLKSPISPEAIAEYNIATANFDVASDTVGADVNAVTKSGTNQFHGSAYEFNEVSTTGARSYFNNTGRFPRFTNNYYGATIGGPVFRDRTFFFGDFLRYSNHSSQFNQFTLPTAAFRNGDLSASPTAIYDPATGGGDPSRRLPFAGNRISPERFSPAAVRILNLLPLPNVPGAGTVNNFQENLGFDQDSTSWDLKFDQRVRAEDHLTYRFSHQTVTTFQQPAFGAAGGRRGLPGDGREQHLQHGRRVHARLLCAPADQRAGGREPLPQQRAAERLRHGRLDGDRHSGGDPGRVHERAGGDHHPGGRGRDADQREPAGGL
jgi:hypothetical protein